MKKTLIYIGLLLMAGISNSCLKEDDLKQPYQGFIPEDIQDGWVISDPASENIDQVELDMIYRDVYADSRNWMMRSLLVFRNGKLVAESYLRDNADRTKKTAIWSCTKQVNSLITGIAIEQGFIDGVDDPISSYLPEYTGRYTDKADILIRHLLTMKSGIDFDNGMDNDPLLRHAVDNTVDYMLERNLTSQPGEKSNYKDSDPHLLSAVIGKAVGKPLDEYGKEVLFDPLGITNYYWHRFPDGVTSGSWGIITTPRELAKIAQCVLDTGRYGGRQVVPASWIGEILKPHVPDVEENLSFGYLWWLHPSKGWYFTQGHGGQYTFIIPDKKMIIAIFSLPNVDDDCNVPLSYHLDLVDRIVGAAD